MQLDRKGRRHSVDITYMENDYPSSPTCIVPQMTSSQQTYYNRNSNLYTYNNSNYNNDNLASNNSFTSNNNNNNNNNLPKDFSKLLIDKRNAILGQRAANNRDLNNASSTLSSPSSSSSSTSSTSSSDSSRSSASSAHDTTLFKARLIDLTKSPSTPVMANNLDSSVNKKENIENEENECNQEVPRSTPSQTPIKLQQKCAQTVILPPKTMTSASITCSQRNSELSQKSDTITNVTLETLESVSSMSSYDFENQNKDSEQQLQETTMYRSVSPANTNSDESVFATDCEADDNNNNNKEMFIDETSNYYETANNEIDNNDDDDDDNTLNNSSVNDIKFTFNELNKFETTDNNYNTKENHNNNNSNNITFDGYLRKF